MASSNPHIADQSEVEYNSPENTNPDDDPQNVDSVKQNVLHEAAYGDTAKLVQLIRSQQINVNDCDAQGRTTVHILAARNNVDVLEILAKENDVDLDTKTFEDLQAPIHYAAKHNSLCTLLYLCENGANIEARDQRARTPLFLAVEYGHTKATRLLLQYNVDFRTVDASGQSILSLMIMNMPDVAEECLDKLIYHNPTTQRSYYYLKCLEPIYNKSLQGVYSRRPMQFIVQYELYNLAKHPIVQKFVNIKWKIYGVMEMWLLLVANLIFVTSWTLFIFLNTVRKIELNKQVLIYLFYGAFCIFEVVFMITQDIYRFLDIKRVFNTWKKQQEQSFTYELKYCNPASPKDQEYLKNKLTELSRMKPYYHLTLWKILEWLLYLTLLFMALIEFASFILRDKRLKESITEPFALVIIPLWLYNIKFFRPFRFFGIFIQLLQKTLPIFVKYLFIFAQIFLALTLSIFFVTEVQFEDYKILDILLLTMFGKIVLDKSESSYLKIIYPILTFILSALLVGFGGILCNNLFIAMLSQVVSGYRTQINLEADVTMERLKILVRRDQNISFYHDRLISHFFICKMCTPLEIYQNTEANTSLLQHLKKSCTAIAEQLHEVGVFLKTKMLDNKGVGGLKQRKQEEKSLFIIQQEVKLLQKKLVMTSKNQEKRNQLLSLEIQLLSCLVETMKVALKHTSKQPVGGE
ncbi:uncharacterized protein LOC103188515 [Callorhinchus milii]|uniref:uncharacterized protein LOC103188515 n=1 Tax=Callorhinchus milii TaxID=7868 RepID=UPI0004572EC6|nr:uncharacterized protein LOC103188515 [Callorhinchus milii]|eukprot:gi/632979917/ref/XP_007906739.1/ PREDICTED: uncharacterized protein LOC103188515 isoform X1 [Callorhinchus milii]